MDETHPPQPVPIPTMREQFGDLPRPQISRKITACVACRKQKIRCQMEGDGRPCVRCRKRGLSCTVNKSLQMILQSDIDWKTKTDARIRGLEKALLKIASCVSMPELMNVDETEHQEENDLQPEQETPLLKSGPDFSPQSEKHTQLNFKIIMDPNCGPAAIPGSVVSPVRSVMQQSKAEERPDIISRGVITLEQAQSYLDIYQNRLDHFLYRIIGDRRTLAEVRCASPLLLASICAVGALHLCAPEFEVCYQEFVYLAAAQTFSRRNSIDDVRALCVAAFWLSGISWTCIGAAVRIATEIQLHRSILKALSGDRTHYLRTRVYYLVYVCDHHFSVAYGRPPMTREDDAIRASLAFLTSKHAVEDDARLVSQVQFWSVGSKIYDTFGVDVEKPMTLSMIEQLRRFSIELDRIRADSMERFTCNPYVGNYPRKGVGLHYHFAKLYLSSLAFRGIGTPTFKPLDVAVDIDEIAQSALLSATSILRSVVTDSEIQTYLNGLPTYFDLMIAFAVVFVLKVSGPEYASSMSVDIHQMHALVRELITVLKNVTRHLHPRHLLVSVANCIEGLFERCSVPSPLRESQFPVLTDANLNMTQPTFEESLCDLSAMPWDGVEGERFFMGDFDLLSSQSVASML